MKKGSYKHYSKGAALKALGSVPNGERATKPATAPKSSTQVKQQG